MIQHGYSSIIVGVTTTETKDWRLSSVLFSL